MAAAKATLPLLHDRTLFSPRRCDVGNAAVVVGLYDGGATGSLIRVRPTTATDANAVLLLLHCYRNIVLSRTTDRVARFRPLSVSRRRPRDVAATFLESIFKTPSAPPSQSPLAVHQSAFRPTCPSPTLSPRQPVRPRWRRHTVPHVRVVERNSTRPVNTIVDANIRMSIQNLNVFGEWRRKRSNLNARLPRTRSLGRRARHVPVSCVVSEETATMGRASSKPRLTCRSVGRPLPRKRDSLFFHCFVGCDESFPRLTSSNPRSAPVSIIPQHRKSP